MRFDWYQGTVAEEPDVLMGTLMRLAPGGSVETCRGMHNYDHTHHLRRSNGERVVTMLSGGKNGHPNVVASGEGCEDFVDLVRECWPEHRVTRADACEDFVQTGSYEALEGVCKAITAAEGVKGRAIVPDDLEDGRTYYMGAASSDVRARLYDKAAEVRRHVAPAQLAGIPSDWTRLEVQVRPRGVFKGLAAHMEAQEFWGFSVWSQKLAAEALQLGVERSTMRVFREPCHDRALRFMLRQYGGVFDRLIEVEASWEQVGVRIGERLEAERAIAWRQRGR
jgi:hypothetical protein